MMGRVAVPVVLALTVLAGVLRFVLAQDNVWADELFLYEIVHGNSLGEALRIIHDTESTPPLYFVLAWIAARVGEDDFFWIRVPSLIMSTATVPLVYLLGLRTVGRTAALIAAGLFAVAPFNLFYGSEARGYAAIAFLCAASTLSLVELLRTGGRRWVLGLAVTTAAAAYTHYLVVFVLAAQFVWALWFHRDRVREVLIGYAGAAVLFAPWLPSALVQFQDNTSERIPGFSQVDQAVEGIASIWVGHPFASFGHIPGQAATWMIALGLAVAAGFALGAMRLRRTAPAATTWLILILAAATPVAALLYELGPNSILLPRYFSASVPAGLLAIGALLVAPRSPLVVAIATVAVVAGVGVGTVRTLEPDGRRPEYRAAAQQLDRVAPPGAPVIELSLFTGPPSRGLGYYFERPHEYFADRRPLGEAYDLGRRAGRLYVFLPEGGIAGFLPALELEERGFEQVDRREWPGTARMVLLTYAPADEA
jgi:mannosyltransferase